MVAESNFIFSLFFLFLSHPFDFLIFLFFFFLLVVLLVFLFPLFSFPYFSESFFFSFVLCFKISFHFAFWNETKWKSRGRELKYCLKWTMTAEDWHTHAQQQYVRLNDAKNPHISLVPHKRPWNKYYFLLKNMAPGLHRFYVINTWKGYCKNLFSKLWCLSKNLIDSIICAITAERFQIVTHNYNIITSLALQELNTFTQKH